MMMMTGLPLAIKDKLGLVIGNDRLDIRIVDLIGVGAFAAVYLGEEQSHGETTTMYAVKTLFKQNLTPEQLKTQRRELDIHAALSPAPGLVTLVDTIEDHDCIYLILELCHDDLYNLIQLSDPLSVHADTDVRALFAQILDAVEYCHDHGVYHRDLKPENLLIDSQGRIKLADFGLATTDRFCTDVGCGTQGYLPPEALCEECHHDVTPKDHVEVTGYDPRAADVWALGMILICMRFRCHLWTVADPTRDASYHHFHSHPYAFLEHAFPCFSDAFNTLLVRVLDPNPATRMTLKELRNEILRDGFTFTNDDDIDDDNNTTTTWMLDDEEQEEEEEEQEHVVKEEEEEEDEDEEETSVVYADSLSDSDSGYGLSSHHHHHHHHHHDHHHHGHQQQQQQLKVPGDNHNHHAGATKHHQKSSSHHIFTQMDAAAASMAVLGF